MKKKKILDISPMAEIEEEAVDKKAEFVALIEAYKVQNPAKYELKKAELEAKLKAIK